MNLNLDGQIYMVKFWLHN